MYLWHGCGQHNDIMFQRTMVVYVAYDSTGSMVILSFWARVFMCMCIGAEASAKERTHLACALVFVMFVYQSRLILLFFSFVRSFVLPF